MSLKMASLRSIEKHSELKKKKKKRWELRGHQSARSISINFTSRGELNHKGDSRECGRSFPQREKAKNRQSIPPVYLLIFTIIDGGPIFVKDKDCFFQQNLIGLIFKTKQKQNLINTSRACRLYMSSG